MFHFCKESHTFAALNEATQKYVNFIGKIF